MKTFLVPTDFSANAENALHFAILMARDQGARILLVNVFHAPLMGSAIAGSVFGDELQALKNSAELKLRTQCIKIAHAGGVPYEYMAREGDTVQVLLEVIRKRNPDFVIMGTKGESDIGQLLFGNNTSELIEKTSCPVMAIPGNARFSKPVKKIAYATSYLKSDIDAIKKMIEIAQPINATISVLHVAEGTLGPDEEAALMGKFMNDIQAHVEYPRVAFEVLNGEDVAERLEAYITTGGADMLVLSTRVRNYFGRLFGDSITKTLTQLSDIPLVAFHHNRKEAEKVY